MLTLEKIKSDFSFIRAWTGNLANYHGTDKFPEHGDFCDIYFRSENKSLTQKQVDIFNDFKNSFDKYISEIERHIQNNLSTFEQNKSEFIRKTTLTFDVIEIQQDNFNYDMVLVCGKTYRKLLVFKKNIDIRVEFKNGRIKSIERKKDTTTEN